MNDGDQRKHQPQSQKKAQLGGLRDGWAHFQAHLVKEVHDDGGQEYTHDGGEAPSQPEDEYGNVFGQQVQGAYCTAHDQPEQEELQASDDFLGKIGVAAKDDVGQQVASGGQDAVKDAGEGHGAENGGPVVDFSGRAFGTHGVGVFKTGKMTLVALRGDTTNLVLSASRAFQKRH